MSTNSGRERNWIDALESETMFGFATYDGFPPPSSFASSQALIVGAVGNSASRVVRNASFLRRVENLAAKPLGVRVHRTLSQLMADPDWQIALVLNPHKTAASFACDYISPSAGRVRAVDTLLRGERYITGLNANVFAVAATLGHVLPYSRRPNILLYGTGAMARATALAVTTRFEDFTLSVVGRTFAQATRVATDPRIRPLASANARHRYDLVINATSADETGDPGYMATQIRDVLAPPSGYLDFDAFGRMARAEALARGATVTSGALTQELTNRLRIRALACFRAPSKSSPLVPAAGDALRTLAWS